MYQFCAAINFTSFNHRRKGEENVTMKLLEKQEKVQMVDKYTKPTEEERCAAREEKWEREAEQWEREIDEHTIH